MVSLSSETSDPSTEVGELEPAELPLLLASRNLTGPEGAFPLDRIRMQKAAFLVTRSGSGEWSSLYPYRPYNWGPYSGSLAHDVEHLQEAGLLELKRHPGGRYGSYVATPAGEERASAAWDKLSEPERRFLTDVYRYVTTRSFQRLLREIYAKFPEYATKSKFVD